MKINNTLKHSSIALAILTTLSACGSSGSGSSSGTPETAVEKSGNVLSDGYLQLATVCLDTKKTNSCDDEDATVKTESGADGSFTLSALASQYAQFAIVAQSKSDGTTTDNSGQIKAGEKLVLSSPPDKTEPTTGNITVSPLTTIVQGYQQANLSLTTKAAEDQVKENLGIDASSSVSLFDDYVEKLKQLAANTTPKPIASGAIATGVLTNQQAYNLFSQVAQVTTETIKKAISDVAADAASSSGVANIKLDTQLDSLIAIVIDDVVNSLPQLVNTLGTLDPKAAFDPAALVTSVGLTIDLTTLANAITNQEQVNTASATGMKSILQNGLNLFNADFFSDAPVFSHSILSLNTSGNALIGTFSEFNPNNSTAGFVVATGNNTKPGSFYLDATSGWTAEPANDITGSSVSFNLDGSANITTSVDSFSISAAVSDVGGQRVADYAPLQIQPSLSTSNRVFATGSKAIRFTFTNLSDSYFLFADSPVDTHGGNGPQAILLSDIITTTAFDITTNTDQITTNDTNPVSDIIGCDSLGNKCIAIEFVGTDASGNVGTSGTANYYLFDFVNRNPTGFHTITKLTGSSPWTIESINTETLLKTTIPVAIKNQLLAFNSFDNESSGILFSVHPNSSGQSAVRRGDFSVIGNTNVNKEWAFNNTGATDVEQMFVNDFTSKTNPTPKTNRPALTDTTVLQAGATFTINLYQYDVVNDIAAISTPNKSFTRAANLAPVSVNQVINLIFVNGVDSAGKLTFEHERLTISSTDTTLGSVDQIDLATGSVIPNTTKQVVITQLSNGEQKLQISDIANQQNLIVRLVPVTGTSVAPTLDVLLITTTTVQDLNNTTIIKFESVSTGTLN